MWIRWGWMGCGEADGGLACQRGSTGQRGSAEPGQGTQSFPGFQCGYFCCLDPAPHWRGHKLQCNLGFQTQHLGLDPKLEWKKFGKEAFKSLIWNRKPMKLFLPWSLIELFFLILQYARALQASSSNVSVLNRTLYAIGVMNDWQIHLPVNLLFWRGEQQYVAALCVHSAAAIRKADFKENLS